MQRIDPSVVRNRFQAFDLVTLSVKEAPNRMPIKFGGGRDQDRAVLANYLSTAVRGRHEDTAARLGKRPPPDAELSIATATEMLPTAGPQPVHRVTIQRCDQPSQSDPAYDTESDNLGEESSPPPPKKKRGRPP